MAVIMKIADDGNAAAGLIQFVLDSGNLAGGCLRVDRHPNQFRPGGRQLQNLPGSSLRIRGIGIGHRLHDNVSFAADGDRPDFDADATSAGRGTLHFSHLNTYFHLINAVSLSAAGLVSSTSVENRHITDAHNAAGVRAQGPQSPVEPGNRNSVWRLWAL